MDNLLKLLARAIASQAKRTQQKACHEAAGQQNQDEVISRHDSVKS